MSKQNWGPGNIVDQVRTAIFERIIRGNYDYDEDMEQLQKLRQQTESLDLPGLGASVLITMAILNNVSGYAEQAEELFWQSYEIYEQLGMPGRMAYVLSNLTFLNITRGDTEKAIELANRGLALIGDDPEHYSVYRHLIANKMTAHLTLEQFDEIRACFAMVEEISDRFHHGDKLEYGRFMSECYRIMAEAELMEQSFDKARLHIGLAEQFSKGLDLTFEVVGVHFAYAHLALLQDNDIETAKQHWLQVDEQLKDVHAPAHVGRAYLDEAYFLHRHNFMGAAHAFAHKAKNIFEEHNLLDHAASAEELLS